jgi:hypothetical protein
MQYKFMLQKCVQLRMQAVQSGIQFALKAIGFNHSLIVLLGAAASGGAEQQFTFLQSSRLSSWYKCALHPSLI